MFLASIFRSCLWLPKSCQNLWTSHKKKHKHLGNGMAFKFTKKTTTAVDFLCSKASILQVSQVGFAEQICFVRVISIPVFAGLMNPVTNEFWHDEISWKTTRLRNLVRKQKKKVGQTLKCSMKRQKSNCNETHLHGKKNHSEPKCRTSIYSLVVRISRLNSFLTKSP